MKVKYLLPTRFKKIGWLIFLISSTCAILNLIFDLEPDLLDLSVFAIFISDLSQRQELFGFISNNVLDEILGVATIVGGLMMAFSKEVDEDELISRMRLESLVWSIVVNYSILILAFLFVYDFSFLWVMLFNMFTPLVFFVVRFNWQISKFRKSIQYEE